MGGLKFELRKNSKLKLTVKNRTRILTKEFAFALSIAFLVHFLAFTLFHIDLGLFSTTHEYPTAIVQGSDLSSPIDSIDQEKPLSIPSFLVFTKQSAPEYPALLYSNEIAFTSYEPTFDLSHLDIASLNRPGASHFFLSCGNTFQKEPDTIQSKNQCRAKLEFKAIPSTGKIFWLDWVESTGSAKLDYQIQEALKTAELNKSNEPIASHGTIEIEFKA
jgi:hypothetical protein